MQLRLKKIRATGHAGSPYGTADELSPTGQPGKRTIGKGDASGTSGGSPTPVKKMPTEMGDIYGKPFETSKDGRPGHGRDYPKFGSHPRGNRGQKPESGSTGGRGHADVSVIGSGKAVGTSSMTGSRPKTVKQMIRQKTGSSHSARMRAEGQKIHAHGLKVGGRSDQKPFSGHGKQLQQPGRPQIAAGGRLDDHMPDNEMLNLKREYPGNAGNLQTDDTSIQQPRVAKYGSAKRFKRLMMTKKSDGGRY